MDTSRLSPDVTPGAGQVRFPNETTPFGLANEQRVIFAWLSMTCGIIWALHLLLASHGVLHDDAIGHFVISREAWHRPTLMLHHWGRPVNTLLYMVPALLGLVYARLASLILAVLTVLLTFLLAKRLRVEYAFMVPALLWFQPWFATWFVHPSMTEIPFSLMMVLSAWLLVSNRVVLASVVIGLFPLLRMEALALTALWVAVCAWRMEWRGVIVASLPTVVYGASYQVVFGHLPGGDFPLIPISLLTRHAPLDYPPWRIYRWLSYPRQLALGAGLPLAALALYGVPRLIASPARLTVLAWYGTYAAVHIALIRFRIVWPPEPRYLLPLAPVVSIAGAAGLETLSSRIHSWLARRQGVGTGSVGSGNLILALVVAAVVAGGLLVSPVPAESGEDAARVAAAWLRQERLNDRTIVSTDVWIYYFLPGHLMPQSERPQRNPENTWSAPPPLYELPPGTIAVWDNDLSDAYGLHWTALSSDREWKILKVFEFGKARRVIFHKHSP